jgi:alpha-tubulin suppressor-like RCC1 family protein
MSGETRCWGDNFRGQLGNGTLQDEYIPVLVLQWPGGPPLSGVQALALAGWQSCALLTNGEARCWGNNYGGQLGDGTAHNTRLTPVSVLQSPGGPPLTSVQALSLGNSHSCALLTSGEARCWGINNTGELGDGTTTERLTPVPVLVSPGGPPLSGVQALTLGDWHSCALLTSGDVRCWGGNGDGQLGDGTTTDQLKPVPVLFPSGAASP